MDSQGEDYIKPDLFNAERSVSDIAFVMRPGQRAKCALSTWLLIRHCPVGQRMSTPFWKESKQILRLTDPVLRPLLTLKMVLVIPFDGERT
ncbi:UNVERIFIED_CONTAM: hypothetical protein K2H54_020709 [Gekko kuhli]